MSEPKGGTGTKPRTAKKTGGGRKATKTTPKGGKPKGKGGKKATGQLSKPPMQAMSEQDIILASLTDDQKNAIVREHKLKAIFTYFKKDIEELGCKVGNVIILDVDGVLYDPESYNIEPETDDDIEDDDDAEHDGDIDDDHDDVTIKLEEWMETYDKTQTWVAKKLGVTPPTVNHWLRDENPTYPRAATEKKVRKLIATTPKRRGRPKKKR